MNDYLKVDHMILKEKREEEAEEKKKKEEWQHVFSLTDSSKKASFHEIQLYFQIYE